MDTTRVGMVYHGRELHGTMDVLDLAPALLAVGQLVEHANHVLNGDGSTIQLLVGDFGTGSFVTQLEFVQKLAGAAKTALELSSYIDTKGLLEIIGITAAHTPGAPAGLLQLLTWKRGREIVQEASGNEAGANPDLERGTVVVRAKGTQDYLRVSDKALRLVDHSPSRMSIPIFMKPLEKPNVESLEFRGENTGTTSFQKDQVPWFAPPHVEDPLTSDDGDDVITGTYDIRSLAFDENLKWRLSDAKSKPFYATIKDPAFLHGVRDGSAAFSKGDRIRVRLRVKQSEGTKGQPKKEYEIVQVLEHVKDSQLSLAVNH